MQLNRLTFSLSANKFCCMKKLNTIRTVKDVIQALGGTSKAAKFFGVAPSSVSNYLADDHIPRGYHRELEMYLRHLGYCIDEEALFGVTLDTLLTRARQIYTDENRAP